MNIAREALEQCGGIIMPEIIFLEKIIEYSGLSNINIALDTIGENMRISRYDSFQDVSIWVGPEGGWSDNERAIMLSNGFIFARFGERILRTETAGIVISFAFIN